ncbi:hypothetical protein [Jatrophihabitans fulvus]
MASPRPAPRSTLFREPPVHPAAHPAAHSPARFAVVRAVVPAVLAVATLVASVLGLTLHPTDRTPGPDVPVAAAAGPPAYARTAPPARAVPAPVRPATPRSAAPPAAVAAGRVVRPSHDPVAPATPTRFRFVGPGFTATANVCPMWDALALDPPGDPDTTVCWVRNNFGVAPGSNTATSYVLGHSFANDPDTALGRLSRTASAQLVKAPTVYRDGVPTRPITVLDGSTLTLWTANGRLDYKVRTAYGVPKPQFGLVQNIVDDTIAKRVLLVTCSVHAGQDLDYNVIVDAYLYSSTSARPSTRG